VITVKIKEIYLRPKQGFIHNKIICNNDDTTIKLVLSLQLQWVRSLYDCIYTGVVIVWKDEAVFDISSN
jgi:hypothetical protein